MNYNPKRIKAFFDKIKSIITKKIKQMLIFL